MSFAGLLILLLGASTSLAQLTIQKQGTFTVINNGNDVEYTFTIEVCNTGSTNQSFVVGDQLPDEPAPCEGTFVSASASNESESGVTVDYTASTEQVEWDSGGDPLAPDACETLTIKVQYDGDCAQNLTNQCQIVEGGSASDDYTFNPNTDLPVELTRFTVKRDGAAAVLRWTTASETQNAGFEVQHQTPGESWAVRGFVEGAGTITTPRQYSYRIPALDPGTHRFRLKQIDFDGTFAYSPESELTVALTAPFELSAVHPNPFRATAQFALAIQTPQTVRVALYDALGRRVRTLHDGALAPNTVHRFRIDGTDLPSGLYLIRAAGEQFTTTRRVTRVR